jgi:hypothetical protein
MRKLNILICNNFFNVQYPIISCYIKPFMFMNSNKKYLYETIVKNSDLTPSQEKRNTCFIG